MRKNESNELEDLIKINENKSKYQRKKTPEESDIKKINTHNLGENLILIEAEKLRKKGKEMDIYLFYCCL